MVKNVIWKDIPGYNGMYKINNYGEIRKYNSYYKFDNRIPEYHNIKQHIGKNGYYRVTLCKDGKVKNCLVHRLVAITFIPNFKKIEEINHKDENKLNNNIDNLEWCTKKYNCNYGTRTKRIAEKMKIINKGKHYSPKTEFKKNQNSKKVLNITKNKIYNSITEASIIEKISLSNIINCCKGKQKTAGGYLWEYC